MTTIPSAGSARIAPAAPNSALTLDFLAWLAAGPRAYGEVMEVWRTSCPRLPIWEDAVDAGLVVRRAPRTRPPSVALTAAGRRALARADRPAG